MVLYFTGTGNSEFVAQKIAQSLGDELLNIGERIKENSFGELYDEKRFVIVTPTYAWRIPRIVESFLKKTDFSGSKKLWFVMNCGGEIGNAEKYIASLCCEKGVDYMGVFLVVMPENYIAMFSVPDKEEARVWGDRIFEKCGIRRDEGGDGGKTLEIRGKRRLSARDEGANYQQS